MGVPAQAHLASQCNQDVQLLEILVQQRSCSDGLGDRCAFPPTPYNPRQGPGRVRPTLIRPRFLTQALSSSQAPYFDTSFAACVADSAAGRSKKATKRTPGDLFGNGRRHEVGGAVKCHVMQ